MLEKYSTPNPVPCPAACEVRVTWNVCHPRFVGEMRTLIYQKDHSQGGDRGSSYTGAASQQGDEQLSSLSFALAHEHSPVSKGQG